MHIDKKRGEFNFERVVVIVVVFYQSRLDIKSGRARYFPDQVLCIADVKRQKLFSVNTWLHENSVDLSAEINAGDLNSISCFIR